MGLSIPLLGYDAAPFPAQSSTRLKRRTPVPPQTPIESISFDDINPTKLDMIAFSNYLRLNSFHDGQRR
jgi:hypothetical protein